MVMPLMKDSKKKQNGTLFKILLLLGSVLFIVKNNTSFSNLVKESSQTIIGTETTIAAPPTAAAVPTTTVGSISNNDDDVYSLAKKESLNFFTDVSTHHWKLLKDRVENQIPNYNNNYLPVWDESTGEFRAKLGGKRKDKRNLKMGHFYQNHFEPEFACQHERRIGRMGDGGKWICDPHRIDTNNCLVYSIGSNNDFSFEMAVQKEISPDCEIHTFDFGNYAEGATKANVTYHQYFVGTDKVFEKRGKQITSKSIKTIVEELGHTGRTIDVFKIDCEGCEWETVANWFDSDVTIRQIQVELHKVDIKSTPKFFDTLWHNHYVITHKEPNIAYPGAIEYAFLKLSSDFFRTMKVRPNASNTDEFFVKFPEITV